MATNETPYTFHDVEEDDMSTPSISAISTSEAIDLRTPSPSSEAEEATSDATTVPLPLPPNPAVTRQDFGDLTNEMRRNSSSMQALLREFITSSREQHRQTSTILASVLEANRRAIQSFSEYRSTGYPASTTPIKISRPVDLSAEPSRSADPKTQTSSNQRSSNISTLRSPLRGGTTFKPSVRPTKTVPLSQRLKSSRKMTSDSEDIPGTTEDTPQDEAAEEASETDTHSTTSRPGMDLFEELVAQRKSLLSTYANRYRHVSTVCVPVNDQNYTLSTNSIPAIVKWYTKLMLYVKDGGTKHYCDLISPRIAEAIQRKCSITPVRFFSLSDQETIDYLFAFVRPSKSLEWSQLFRTCLPYPAYSQVFLNQQTLIMKLDDLAKFVDSTLDLVFVLGDYASPPDRDIRRLFESLLPVTIKDMVKDFAIDVRLPFLQFLPLLKDHIAAESEEQRAAAPLQSHLYSVNVMRASNSPGVQAFHTYNANRQQRDDRQVRASTYKQRAELGVLTADDIYGPGEEQATDEPESTLSEYENQLLEDHGIYAIVSPVKEVQYAAIKREIDYPPHLRFPEGPKPCWTFYNTGICPNKEAGKCPFEHQQDRIVAHVEIKRQREAFLPPKQLK